MADLPENVVRELQEALAQLEEARKAIQAIIGPVSPR